MFDAQQFFLFGQNQSRQTGVILPLKLVFSDLGISDLDNFLAITSLAS